MRASKTHFEQIPVETVKKIAKEFRETSQVQVIDEITPTQERWRQVAEQVQKEKDPKRLTELVEQLLEEFDGKDLHKGPGSVRTKGA
jgi:chromatin segregation and condensation protein Rec8/ScpA/Scc1 (kleisin family)